MAANTSKTSALAEKNTDFSFANSLTQSTSDDQDRKTTLTKDFFMVYVNGVLRTLNGIYAMSQVQIN